MKSFPAIGLGNPNRVGTSDQLPTTPVVRDPDGNTDFNTANRRGVVIVTDGSATPIVLTRASPPIMIFTGTTTQLVNLPPVNTLRIGWEFRAINLSTGNVNIRTSAGSTIRTLVANTNVFLTCILLTGTSPTAWNNVYSAITFALAKSLLINKIMTIDAGADNLTLNLNVLGGTLAHAAYLEPTGGYTVADLTGSPAADFTGGSCDRTFVTDALAPVFGAVVAGSGAVFVPVYKDNAGNWRVG